MTIEQRTRDLESQHTRANIARLEAETARAETAAQLSTIEQQRTVIREMSVPILPLTTTTLVLPLDRRAGHRAAAHVAGAGAPRDRADICPAT